MQDVILTGYDQYGGRHPETAALKNVLAYYGVSAPHTAEPFTEAMLLGIGGLGAGYILWEFQAPAHKAIVLGFHSHWQYPERYMENLCRRLGIAAEFKTTGGEKTAAKQLRSALQNHHPALAWVDPSGLAYRFPRVPLNGHGRHVVGVCGLKGEQVLLDDRSEKVLAMSADAFAQARARVGSFKNRLMLVEPSGSIDIKNAIHQGLVDCIGHLSQKSDSFSLPAFRKWARLMTDAKNKKGWPVVFADTAGLYTTLRGIYEAVAPVDTSGGTLRDMYAEFLAEAAPVIGKPELTFVAEQYKEIAADWHGLAEAALPDSIAAFKETKDLLAKKSAALIEHGLDGLDDMRTIARRLYELESELDATIPLSNREIHDLFADVGSRIGAIYQAEVAALTALQEAL